MASNWSILRVFRLSTLILFLFFASTSFANVKSVEFRFSLLSALSEYSEIAQFYEQNEFKPIWVGNNRSAKDRRSYFFKELKNASAHALPILTHDADYLKNQFRQARTASELGLIEALITLKFIDYSSKLQTGVLKPVAVDKEIVRKVPYRSVNAYLTTLTSVKPQEFFKGLYPRWAM